MSGEGIKPKRTRAAELHNMSERVLSLLYTITTAKTGLINNQTKLITLVLSRSVGRKSGGSWEHCSNLYPTVTR